MLHSRLEGIVSDESGIQRELTALEVTHRDDHCAMGVVENVMIAVWSNETQVATVRLLGAEVKRLAAKWPRAAVGLLQVVEDTCGAHLGPDERAEFSKILRSGGDYIRCSSVVFEGSGFRAAALRGIVTGVALFARAPFPHTVFAKADSAVDWQVAHLRAICPNLTPGALITGVNSLRKSHVSGPLEQTG